MRRLLRRWAINEEGRLVRPSGVVCDPAEAITAREVRDAIGIPESETTWFNHNGLVPAAHVVREALERGVRGRAPGAGPKLRGDEPRSETVTVRLTPTERNRLRELGISPADAIRAWLATK